VFFGGMDSVGGPLLRQMKALGINAKYMGGDGICTESLPKLAGTAAANGVVTCAEAGGVTAEQQRAWMISWRATRRSTTPTCRSTRRMCTTR
jgi:branched-chain amino acid transport system substrate-binding protein